MNLLPRRSLLAVAAVVDIAYHARPTPIAAKTLAARHGLPPRHLETLLQVLVRAGILKGVRGPRGGYELARERRRITIADIVRAALGEPDDPSDPALSEPKAEDDVSPLVAHVVTPMIRSASEAFLERLDEINVEELCTEAERRRVFGDNRPAYDFTI
ncbi:RrF2 family transcriptional regulator [Hansschlegelia plantiphila]|uniref:Rrf2 family transcriptional regulator n=1 Tax=Hansschlegelia plantiphila TaxID=374655 RepID=A0A9W6J3P2_9HYPH|nr:Rrf2 family transcriptional regulator [Hansschlegelia plantiphila]GLK68768.1 Rrf2 family transcriptional regulator [Hansschlegelia plantiphila]